MKKQILISGPAGSGPNILTHILAKALIKKGYFVFYSRDYPSLIRGGNNFNLLTFSNKPIYSNQSKNDIFVGLDETRLQYHKSQIHSNTLILQQKKENMFFAGALFKILGFEFKDLDDELKELKNRYQENLEQAKQGFESQEKKYSLENLKNKNLDFLNGSQAIANSAIKSGLDFYYAYPMTPATPVLTEISQAMLDKNSKHKSIQLENEIAVANAGVGSTIVGKKVMVGTSGGGFDLMTETLSLCGIAQIPLIFYLAQRPGPATGVATYTAQGDLNIALYAGHGEFNRIVLAPSDPLDSEELTNQAFYLAHKFSTPTIILSDKHLAESFYTINKKPNINSIKFSPSWKRYNSYETNPKTLSATEEPKEIVENINARKKVFEKIKIEINKFKTFEIQGKKSSKNLIISWGSTKGAVLDAIEDLDCTYLQIKFLMPFPNIEKILKNKNLILVENNSQGLLGDLIKLQTGIEIKDKNKILRYDGRPFLSDELNKEIKKRLK